MLQRLDDEALMIRYRDEGDTRSFDVLYGRHRSALYRFLLRQTANAADAQELFQDVWLKVIRARERYKPEARFATYLYHLAHNRLIDHYRRRTGRVPLSYDQSEAVLDDAASHPEEGPDAALDRAQGARRLAALIADLPAAQREALLLHFEAGLTHEQLAYVMGVGAETVKSRLRYAIRKLRDATQEDPS
jgi:RNA polymerase sigma-70 factor (ECF subfamily)